jgi:hypothetical protein
MLPVGVSDQAFTTAVKLYCPKCEDVYNPKSIKYNYIDGAYFGTSFPHMLLQVYTHLAPVKTVDRYVPRVFGFKVSHHSRRIMTPPPELTPEQTAGIDDLDDGGGGDSKAAMAAVDTPVDSQ